MIKISPCHLQNSGSTDIRDFLFILKKILYENKTLNQIKGKKIIIIYRTINIQLYLRMTSLINVYKREMEKVFFYN